MAPGSSLRGRGAATLPYHSSVTFIRMLGRSAPSAPYLQEKWSSPPEEGTVAPSLETSSRPEAGMHALPLQAR